MGNQGRRVSVAVFPRLALVVCFPALGTRCMFSPLLAKKCAFQLFALAACFLVFGSDDLARFPALGIGLLVYFFH